MQDGWLVVLLKIVSMFLVIMVGWLARRRAALTVETTGTLSRFVVDITLPALVFTQMLATVDLHSLRASWYITLLGLGIPLVGLGVGWLIVPFFSRGHQRNTFVFLVAMANWVYLPLPIVQALYGNDGVRAVLLANVGASIFLWSLGVWTVRGGKPDWHSLRELALNPGLIATFAGILLALLVPSARGLVANSAAGLSLPAQIAAAVMQALVLVGSLTIPLSLIVIGAQLGGIDLSDHSSSYTVFGVLLGRLFLTPLATVMLVMLLAKFGARLPETARLTGYIIAAMPVAVSCSIFTERYGGDTPLAARAIFYSTLLSIITVPAIFWLVQRLGV